MHPNLDKPPTIKEALGSKSNLVLDLGAFLILFTIIALITIILFNQE